MRFSMDQCPFKSRFLSALGSCTYPPVFQTHFSRVGLQVIGLMLRVCAKPSCPSIIQMYEYIIRPSYTFIVMELLESSFSLTDYMKRQGGPLEEEQGKSVFQQIVEAVMHCHSRGVFHSDIKPRNILFQSTTGQVKLIDFGCGGFLLEEKYARRPGTLAYCPPEYFLYKKYKPESANVWSLGITLFELLSGFRPFQSSMEIMTCSIHIPDHLSQGKCGNGTSFWEVDCLCLRPRDRPTLKDILRHSCTSFLSPFNINGSSENCENSSCSHSHQHIGNLN
uniref:Serine/threonine-protein kinase 1 n=1 Tax=Erpetoichthys calabaricus TaxID=27687 RepID=A0A8C4T5T9_ERPCA